MQGPNVKKLIVEKMSLLMIPPGCKDGLATGVAALTKPGNVQAIAKEATEWVNAAIAAVRAAPGENPWREANEESIAGEILKGINERRRKPQSKE